MVGFIDEYLESVYSLFIIDDLQYFYDNEKITIMRNDIYVYKYIKSEIENTLLNTNYNKPITNYLQEGKFEKGNENYFILALDPNILNTYNDHINISINDVIYILDYINMSEYKFLHVNNKLTKKFIDKLAKYELGQQSYNYNKKTQYDRIEPYSKENEENYLFRGCQFEEIKNLLFNGYIKPINFNNIYLTKSSNYAASRLNIGQEYLVIYDRQKLINQGAILVPDTIVAWNNMPESYKEQTGFVSLSLDDPDNKSDLEEFLKNHPEKNIEDITFADLDIYWEYEAIIPEIKFESGLIHNILIICPDDSDIYKYSEVRSIDYYKKYNKLKELLKEHINLIIIYNKLTLKK
jgi:hypothetical protein